MTVADPANPLINAARAFYDAGFCVVPSHEDGSKRPFGPWKKYQIVRPEWDVLLGWLCSGKYTGVGVIMGAVSNHAEMAEIEGPLSKVYERIAKVIEESKKYDEYTQDLVQRILDSFIETTPGGGLHFFFFVDGDNEGNQKLAETVDGKVIAETRGEGGFVVVYPTTARNGHEPGTAYELYQGHPSTVTTISEDDRGVFYHVLKMALNEKWPTLAEIPTPKPASVAPAPEFAGVSPFDDYRAKVTWREIMEAAGWVYHSKDAVHDYWTRPGKNPRDGHSASTIEDGPLFVFSSSVTDIPREVGLSKPQVFAHLHHGGDLSAATRALRDAGYGDPLPVLATWNPPAQIDSTFWDLHPTLGLVREAAYARMVSADAVLACVLARIVQHIPYEYVIPPIVGGRSTPNLFVALIGPSGTGKGGARRAADDFLGHIPAMRDNPVTEGPLGSGEGIVSMFYDYPEDPETGKQGKSLEMYYRSAMILDEEGSALAELIKRQGQVTEQVLLKMWSGERLGFSYSARGSGLRLSVPDGEYRASALLGVQPGAAAFLLDDARSDRGLPQRFLWASTIDPNVPNQPGAFPPALNWSPPTFGGGLDQSLIDVADDVQQTLRQSHHARVTGTGSLGLESHGGLVQLKTATALAALLNPGQPLAVDVATWELAGQLKTASDAVRESVAQRARDDVRKVAQARTDVAIRQRVAVQEVDAQVKNCARRIARHVTKHHSDEGAYCTRSCARRAMTAKYRDVFDAALECAMNLDWVVDNSDGTEEISHFQLGESSPL